MRRIQPSFPLLVTSVSLAVSLVACKDSFDNATKNIEEATKDVEKASANLQQGMNSVAKLDPFALNKLLTENTELRKVAEELRTKLNSATNASQVYVGPQSRVLLEITGYRGQLRMDAWVDQERNKFIQNRVLEAQDVPLDMDPHVASRQINTYAEEAFRRYVPGRPFDDIAAVMRCGLPGEFICQEFVNKVVRGRDQIDTLVNSSAKQALERYLAAPFALPSTHMKTHAIDRRFGTAGEHSVMLRLTPEMLDSTKQWRIEYRVYIQQPNDRQDQIGAGNLDSQTSNYTLGKALRPIEIAYAKVTVGQ